MNSYECKLKIKVCYKDKYFEDESDNIIPLLHIKEKSIKKFNIKKEDEEFIIFEYHSNKESKNIPIENENSIIQYSNEDSSGNLFCKLELIINNPKEKSKDNKLSSEIKVEKIESEKSSTKYINEISDKEKKIYENEINKLKLEIEEINNRYNSELANLKKENSEKEKKVKVNENIINLLKKKIKNKENEIININSEINNLKKEYEKINNWNEFIEKVNKSYDNLLKVKSAFEEVIEEMKLNKKILDGNIIEKNEEKKEIEENEKNKNIELIKSVIEQMKLEQNNEVIEKNKKLEEKIKILEEKYKNLEEGNKIFEEKNKILEEENRKLEEENKMHKNKINEMENQIKKNIQSNFESEITFLKCMFEKMVYTQEEIKNISSIIKCMNTKEKETGMFSSWFSRNKNENSNKVKNNKNSNIINNNEAKFFKPQINHEINNDKILFDYFKENNINNNSNININDLYYKDKYNNLSEQLKSFYGSNISNEKILKILNKIKEIISLVQ